MKYVWSIIGIIVLIGQIFLPVILHPAAAEDIILHGFVGVVLIICVALLAIALFMRHRKPLSSGQAHKIMAAFFFGGFILFSIHEIRIGEALAAIQQHGQRTTAVLLDLYTDSCSKRGCSYTAKYQFTPSKGAGAGQPVIAYASMGVSERADPERREAESTRIIPVAYEIDNPQNSTTNYNEMAFSGDPMARSITLIEAIGCVGIAAIALFGLGWLITRMRLRKAASSD